MTNEKNFTPVGSLKETEFLEGPQSRWKEFTFLLQVVKQFFYGFRKLHFIGPCITIFGSARYDPGHRYYHLARTIGSEISKLGFTIITGGGPGLMEAANRGAKDVHGRSIGCNINLPKEQKPNIYLDKWVDFDYFFIRKTLLSKYSYGFIVLPGGYGTLDEFFEAITLIQTGKFQKFPIVLFDSDYHSSLYEHLKRLIVEGTIDPQDINLFLLTDSIDEAVQHIVKYSIGGFNLRKKRKYLPIPILGERK